ncbi:hypothetical protein ACFV1N_25420 [Streptosporangium canum]|uniref:hypothetical protein n=1 Tax=Streptosporangium canum TaxID=324952 RepID=UPI00368105E3
MGGMTQATRCARQPVPFRPYTDEEVAALGQWAAAQSEPLRAQCHLLLALCAGCGLHPEEAFRVRVGDVRFISTSSVAVAVAGPHERVIICSSDWEETLRLQTERLAGQDGVLLQLEIWQQASDGFSGPLSASEQVAALWARSTVWPAAPTVCMERLRDTWLSRFTFLALRPEVLAAVAGVGSVWDLPAVLRPGMRQDGEHDVPAAGEEPAAALPADSGVSQASGGEEFRPVGGGVPDRVDEHVVGVEGESPAAARHREHEGDRLFVPAADQVTPRAQEEDAPLGAEPAQHSEHAAEPRSSGASHERPAFPS